MPVPSFYIVIALLPVTANRDMKSLVITIQHRIIIKMNCKALPKYLNIIKRNASASAIVD